MIRTSLPKLALALSLAASVCATLVWHVGTLHHWDWHAAYLAALAWAFVFWNSVRILTYVPTLRLLMQPGASAAHYSVATWASWVLSNATLALYLFETGGRSLNSLVLLSFGNALMCLITCALIVRLRWRDCPRPELLRGHAVNSGQPPDDRSPSISGSSHGQEAGALAIAIVSSSGPPDIPARAQKPFQPSVSLAVPHRLVTPAPSFARSNR